MVGMNLLRWIAVLPGSILAALIALVPLHIVLYLIFQKFFEVYPEAPERILGPAVISGVFVFSGFKIAPSYKFETAVVLFGLWMFLLGGLVFTAWFERSMGEGHLYFQSGGIPTIMGAVGAIIGLVLAWHDGREKTGE